MAAIAGLCSWSSSKPSPIASQHQTSPNASLLFTKIGSCKPWSSIIRSLKQETESQFPIISTPNQNEKHFPSSSRLNASLGRRRSPRGFGPSKSPNKRKKTTNRNNNDDGSDEEEEEEEGEDDEEEEGVIPEIVTNRMMSRIGFTVGVPLLLGLLFFPLFYYLKVGLKIDVPNWVPFIVSFVFFGAAFLGVSYGIVSSSWDPMREGSLLGWNEAQKNWPVFWQSLRGNRSKN